ncbi:hypothetical protein G5I_07793 [Acromyrmex echinatior]|uniref:Uncharacterized protein n=1 Tax=Acromyrmex echinatior TaxID=103372 RepID=F4WPS9_ACREC|nr:hypothetical protein G5I_07793 [Acromyrmex echinatior]
MAPRKANESTELTHRFPRATLLGDEVTPTFSRLYRYPPPAERACGALVETIRFLNPSVRESGDVLFPSLEDAQEKLSGNICPAGLRLNDKIFRGADTRQIMSSLLKIELRSMLTLRSAFCVLRRSVSGNATDLTFLCTLVGPSHSSSVAKNRASLRSTVLSNPTSLRKLLSQGFLHPPLTKPRT